MRKVAGIIVFMLAFLGLVGCGSKSYEIQLKDYVSISASGYSGEAYVDVDFEEDRFRMDLLKNYGYTVGEFTQALSSAETKEKELKKLANLRKVMDSIKFNMDTHEGFSNGSEVVYTVEYDTEAAGLLKLTLNTETEAHVVEGLEEYEKLTGEDLREDIEVTVTGIAPKLNVEVNYVGDMYGVWVSYVPEKSALMDDGRIVVRIEVDQTEVQNYGYASEEPDYYLEYPVDIELRYVSKPDEISDELWGRIGKELKDRVVSGYYTGATVYMRNKGDTRAYMYEADSVGDPRVKEAYILHRKSEEGYPVNMVTAIFELQYKGPGYGYDDAYVDAPYFIGVTVPDIVVGKDGNTEGMLIDATVEISDFDFATVKNYMITRLVGDYRLEEVPVDKLNK